MDKDSDKALVRNGYTRHVENMRTYVNGGRKGVETSIKGNELVADEAAAMNGSSISCVGAVYYPERRCIYYLLGNSDGSHSRIVEWNKETETSTIVADDATLNILKFQTGTPIMGIAVIDGMLAWANPNTEPMIINIDRMKALPVDGFETDDVYLATRPPKNKPGMVLSNTLTSPTTQENNILEKMASFSYRWLYENGEYSVPAPFTEYAFYPEDFQYDYAQQANKGMVNRFNQVKLTLDTGSHRVKELQVLYREAESTELYLVGDYNKQGLGWSDNAQVVVEFDNNKLEAALSRLILRNYYSNVPHNAKNLLLIGRRLLLGDYTDNYDMVHQYFKRVEMDYRVDVVSLPNYLYDPELNPYPSLVPRKTVKSNRDVQVGFVYSEPYGRTSTVMLGTMKPTHIPAKNSPDQNYLQVTANHLPPAWATHYRFFVQVNKGAYDSILPNLFYEDGPFRWVKLEGADKNKVQEGDYLIVKSDTQGPMSRLVKTKVLEVKNQPQNFLQAEDVTSTIEELPGLYFKIRPEGDFRMDFDDLDQYELETYDSSRREYNNPIRNLSSFVSPAFFYGSGLNDATAGGTYTGSTDDRNRFIVEIDSVGGTDTFRWSDNNGSSWTAGVAITGAAQNLSNGITITFAATTGHTMSDRWTINARAEWSTLENGNSYGFFRINKKWDEQATDPEDEIIRNGARIKLEYFEYGRGNDSFVINNISSAEYANIQEWFYEEGIAAQIEAQCSLTFADHIHFMKGVIGLDGNATYITQDDANGITTICVRSKENGTALERVKTRAISSLLQATGYFPIAFETDGQREVDGIYFEVGKTYDIVNGYHQADVAGVPTDRNQNLSQPLVAKVDFFNAFSYGNSVESYKIRDDFNGRGMDNGVRTLGVSTEEFKETRRKASVTWSDVYDDEGIYNGLTSFFLSETNYIDMDEEDGAITGLVNSQGNVQIIQEHNIQLVPYLKNVIQDVQGGEIIGIAQNILDKRSARPYQGGKYGCQNRESVATDGFRTYFVDRERGVVCRLSIDGVTPATKNDMNYWFLESAKKNDGNLMVACFDVKTDEYLVGLVSANTDTRLSAGVEGSVMAFSEYSKGFPLFYTFNPDFMVSADDVLFSFRAGRLYEHERSETHNNFYGVQYQSKVVYVANDSFGVEKIAKAIRLHSNKPWTAIIQSRIATSRIAEDCFEKLESHYFASLGRNEDEAGGGQAEFGLGTYAMSDGQINVFRKPALLQYGDILVPQTTTGVPTITVVGIDDEGLIQTDQAGLNLPQQFFTFKKNAKVEGGSIRGDYFEVELINGDDDETWLASGALEIIPSMLTE